MIAAISHGSRTDISRQDTRQAAGRKVTAPPAPPAAKAVPWHSREGVYFVPVRELNDETRAAIRKAQCQATWAAIHDALHDQARRGRTAAIRDAARMGVLDDVGIMGLSRYSGGLTPKTIRRQLDCLQAIGIAGIGRPTIQFTLRDGRLCKAKGQGREKAVRIFVTVDAERHCRPGKALRLASESRRPDAGSYGYAVPTSTPVLMGSQYPPSRDSLSKNTASAPETDGIGSVAAANGAGGLTAAVHEEGDGMTFVPALPPPRPARPAAPRRQASTPADPARTGRPASRSRGTAGQEPPKDFTKVAADWHRVHPVVAAAKAAKAAAKAEREAAKAGTAGQAPESPSAPARPAGTIPRGQDEAPVRTPTPQVDADAAELAALVSNIRQAIGIGRQDAYREGWHADRAG